MHSRNKPISSIDVEQQLIQTIASLEECTEHFEFLAEDHAVKEAALKKQWYAAYLSSTGPVKEKEAIAGSVTSSLYLEVMVAEAKVKAQRERLNALRTACDGLRTIAANVRVQVK